MAILLLALFLCIQFSLPNIEVKIKVKGNKPILNRALLTGNIKEIQLFSIISCFGKDNRMLKQFRTNLHSIHKSKKYVGIYQAR